MFLCFFFFFFEISETFDSFKIKTKVLKVITLGRNTFGSLGQGFKNFKKRFCDVAKVVTIQKLI